MAVKRDKAKLIAQVLAARDGDRTAYGQLVDAFQGVVMAVVYPAVRRREVAEDLAQECFIKAYFGLRDLREPEKFVGWLRRIASHTATDWLRGKRSEIYLEKLAEAGIEPSAPEVGPGNALEDEEEHNVVLKALEELREDYRDIIVMKHLENRSYRYIANALGMSITAVGEKLSRVRALLKDKLRHKLDLGD